MKDVPLVLDLPGNDLVGTEGTGGEDDAEQRKPHRNLVADHLDRGAKPAEEGVLVVRCPPAEPDPVDPERSGRDEEDDTDVHIRTHDLYLSLEVHEGQVAQFQAASPGNDGQPHDGRDHRHSRRQ